jgi:hypothetical protein
MVKSFRKSADLMKLMNKKKWIKPVLAILLVAAFSGVPCCELNAVELSQLKMTSPGSGQTINTDKMTVTVKPAAAVPVASAQPLGITTDKLTVSLKPPASAPVSAAGQPTVITTDKLTVIVK